MIAYDFQLKPILDEKGGLELIYKAIIPARLGNPKTHRIGSTPQACYVDSGSDMNLFPASWGETVGITVQKGTKQNILGIGGKKTIGYKHKVDLYLDKYQINNVWGVFCFDHYIPLLGRTGFFDKFEKIVFNEKYSRLELYP